MNAWIIGSGSKKVAKLHKILKFLCDGCSKHRSFWLVWKQKYWKITKIKLPRWHRDFPRSEKWQPPCAGWVVQLKLLMSHPHLSQAPGVANIGYARPATLDQNLLQGSKLFPRNHLVDPETSQIKAQKIATSSALVATCCNYFVAWWTTNIHKLNM